MDVYEILVTVSHRKLHDLEVTSMTNQPTINLQITDAQGHMLGEIERLPVPTHTTPDGHIIVDSLTNIFEASARAFADTWQQHCVSIKP